MCLFGRICKTNVWTNSVNINMWFSLDSDWSLRPGDKTVCEGDDVTLRWEYPHLQLGRVYLGKTLLYQRNKTHSIAPHTAKAEDNVIDYEIKNVCRDKQGYYKASAYSHNDTEAHHTIKLTVSNCPLKIEDAILVFSLEKHVKVSYGSVKHVCIQAGANFSVGVEQECLLPNFTITSTCPHVTGRKTLTLMGTMKSNNCSFVLKATNGNKTVRVTSIGKFIG